MKNKLVIKKILKFISVVIILVILFLAFMEIYSLLAFPNTTLDYETYAFRISVVPLDDDRYAVTDFAINYNFVNEKGDINFRFGVKESKNIESLEIEIPDRLKIFEWKVLDHDSQKRNGDQECDNFGNRLSCSFKKPLENQLDFKINISQNKLKDKFYPNGLFILGDVSEISLSMNEGYDKDNLLLDFYLGDKYRCQENCFIREMKSEKLDYYFDRNHLIVYMHQGEGGIVNLPHFRLNTYNHWKKTFFLTLLTLLISLLAGIIVLTLQNISRIKKFFLRQSYLSWPWSSWAGK